MLDAPQKYIFHGTLFDAAHEAGIHGRFEAYDSEKAMYFAKMRLRPIFIDDQDNSFEVTQDWTFTEDPA